MPLSWNEIKSRASNFSKRWEDASNEASQAKPFLIDFFEVFGITNKRVATFEHAVKKHGGKDGFVDLFWPGILLVEMKSEGKNLERAYSQAIDYFSGIKERDLPRYVLVCDFQRFELHDLTEDKTLTFKLAELYQHVKSFGFIAGYQTQIIKPQDPINIKAAERMGNLHDALKAIGYEGHPLELYLVRLLFCLFAEDTTIFEKSIFQSYIENRTAEDGSDLAHHLSSIFYILNTPESERLKNLDEDLAQFPYVNGRLFEERLPPAQFDKAMREALLELCALDWSIISPAIFGSLFQSIMDAKARRNLGAHYTSEENILKLIKPLFLDGLWQEFEKVKRSSKKLNVFHQKLRSLTFFDPACGCGNFLVITYREMRLLEIETLRALNKSGQQVLDVDSLIQVNVDQFYGIEIEEFPAQIAQVALWLTDHQMNMWISEEFGNYFARIPLKSTPHILNANALQEDWNQLLPARNCSYILGNPPFLGKKEQNKNQKNDLKVTCNDIKGASVLDFVSAWYVKSSLYTRANHGIHCAFVSTNSITQGEQVGLIWDWMLKEGNKINFAHRTFNWSNEAKGKAAVHCVIIGFSKSNLNDKTIFEYENTNGAAHAIKAKNINPYLVDAPDFTLKKVSKPKVNVPKLIEGITPLDNGILSFTNAEYKEFISIEPQSKKWFKQWLTGHSFINSIQLWCLWLSEIQPNELRKLPEVIKLVNEVKKFRVNSKSSQKFASTPWMFRETSIAPRYLLIPKTSSENRQYVPIGFVKDAITSSSSLIAPFADLFHFGVLTSRLHNAWIRTVCGRLKSDFRYSAGIVYNNFPWPTPNSKLKQAIEVAAQDVLNARSANPKASLADLYDPLTMPANLLKAHQALDKAVDAAYGYKRKNTDAARVAFLFEEYEKITSLLTAKPKKKSAKR